MFIMDQQKAWLDLKRFNFVWYYAVINLDCNLICIVPSGCILIYFWKTNGIDSCFTNIILLGYSCKHPNWWQAFSKMHLYPSLHFAHQQLQLYSNLLYTNWDDNQKVKLDISIFCVSYHVISWNCKMFLWYFMRYKNVLLEWKDAITVQEYRYFQLSYSTCCSYLTCIVWKLLM